MFILSVLICVSVSLLTSPQAVQAIQGLSMGTLSSADKQARKSSFGSIDIALSIVLLIIVVTILSYFTG
jgi:SSS family solute:Na+ symporter